MSQQLELPLAAPEPATATDQLKQQGYAVKRSPEKRRRQRRAEQPVNKAAWRKALEWFWKWYETQEAGR